MKALCNSSLVTGALAICMGRLEWYDCGQKFNGAVGHLYSTPQHLEGATGRNSMERTVHDMTRNVVYKGVSSGNTIVSSKTMGPWVTRWVLHSLYSVVTP